jgi:hypothetical protein
MTTTPVPVWRAKLTLSFHRMVLRLASVADEPEPDQVGREAAG